MKFTKAIEHHKKELIMTKMSGTKFFECKQKFDFYIKYTKTNKGKVYKDGKVTIKEGTLSDFASFPIYIRIIALFFGVYIDTTKYISFWLHDEIYKADFKGIKFRNFANIPNWLLNSLNKEGGQYIVKPTRLQCDKILDEALKIEGAGVWYRFVVRVGLFIGGWIPYYFKKIKGKNT